MNKLLKASLTCILITFVIEYSESTHHCHADDIRTYAVEACLHVLSHVTKRQIDRYEYRVENIKARTTHSKHHQQQSFLIAKKITSDRFPQGAYLLIHYPFAKHLFSMSSKRNQQQQQNNEITSDLEIYDEISNEIKSNSDSYESNEIVSSKKSSHHNSDLKNKYSFKFKRNTDDQKTIIEHCCPGGNHGDICGKYFC